MPFIHLAQATDVPDAEVVEQAVRVIDTFSSLGPFMAVLAVITLAFLVILVVVFSGRNAGNVAMSALSRVNADKDEENKALKEEKRDDKLRQQQYQEQFLAMMAVIAGKQTDITTGLTSSEARLTSQISTSETTIKGRVQTVGDANIARLDKIDKALAVIQSTVNLFTDPDADAKYDKALEILTAKLEVMAADIKDIAADVASNTEVGTANTTAITDAADALVAANVTATTEMPAAVVIADISPAAVETLVSAVTMLPTHDAGAATEGGGSEERIAS